MTNIKHISFLCNTSWIIISEYCIYCVFNDYSSFVDRLTSKLASINILYVKAFQAIALNNNLITDEMNNKLLSFTDNAPWSYEDIDTKLLDKVTNDLDIVLKDGYNTPLNSGMISLVYKAYKKQTNEPIILKIKRVNIDKKLNDAIDHLLYFVDFLSFIPLFKKYKVSYTVHNIIDVIEEQTNFNSEVENMIRIKNNCKDLKYVKIPDVNKDVTEKYQDVIMMEYIEGMSINDIKLEDYKEFAKQVMKFGFVTTILHGTTHGDLHSGNILFIKDDSDAKYKYKIGVIDFGIIYDIEKEYKEVLFEIFSDLFTLSSKEIATKILLSGIVEPIDVIKTLPKDHYNSIIEFTSKIIENTIHDSKQATQKQLYRFLSEFYSYLNNNNIINYGLRPSDSFIKTQMCLAMAHGVTLKLCEDDSIAIADKVLNELFHMDILLF